MPASQVYNNVPKMGGSGARKRCRSAKENWENQKTNAMKQEAANLAGEEFSGEIMATLEDQWVWGGEGETAEARSERLRQWQLKHGWMRPGQKPYDPLAGKYMPTAAQAEAGAKMIVPGASSLSWTSADAPVDATAKERNSNRQQAPIDWAASAEQDRGAVMGILGGRK